MSINKLYDAWSASYDTDRNLTRDLAGTILRKKFEEMHCDTLIEAGCGTGGNTFFLSSICRHLIGLDFSEGMLRVVREKAALGGTASHVELLQADITQPWPVPPASAEAVVIILVLEHIENLVPVFAEAYHALGPGGKLCICELHPERQLLGGRATFERDGSVFEIPAFIHTEDQFRSSAERAGFSEIMIESHHHSEDSGKPPRILSVECRR